MSFLLCGEVATTSFWYDTAANWAQGIGALLGIPGAIAAFWILFKRDKEKEEAVRQLTEQTKHLGDQVKAIGEQTAELRVQSMHMSNIHGVLAQVLSQNAAEVETRREIERLERQPYLRNTSDSWGTVFGANLGMINNGGLAQNLRVLEVSKPEISLRLSDERVERGGTFALIAQSVAGKLDQRYSFVIQFEDAVGLRYRQRFNAAYINASESEPERITP